MGCKNTQMNKQKKEKVCQKEEDLLLEETKSYVNRILRCAEYCLGSLETDLMRKNGESS